MAIYEFYCPTCKTQFERRMPMSAASREATCEQGHTAERTISTFAVATAEREPSFDPASFGGGCACGGGGCGCQN